MRDKSPLFSANVAYISVWKRHLHNQCWGIDRISTLIQRCVPAGNCTNLRYTSHYFRGLEAYKQGRWAHQAYMWTKPHCLLFLVSFFSPCSKTDIYQGLL